MPRKGEYNKYCSRCGGLWVLVKGPRGLRGKCPPCDKEKAQLLRESRGTLDRVEQSNYQKAYRARTQSYLRRPHKLLTHLTNNQVLHIQQRYKITPEQYHEMLTVNGGLCAVCKEPGKRLNIDHDHDTGEIRGLLCHGCNTLVGYLETKPNRLNAALAYLGKGN